VGKVHVHGLPDNDYSLSGRARQGVLRFFFTAIRFRTEIAKNASEPLIDQFAPIRPEDLDVNVKDGVTTILWHLHGREQ
jgi:hypothetical protein